MSLQPQPAYVIPEETRRVAHAAFPKGAFCLRLVEALGQLYLDEQFVTLFPTRGQPAAPPARLALVLVLQYRCDLGFRQKKTFCRELHVSDWRVSTLFILSAES